MEGKKGGREEGSEKGVTELMDMFISLMVIISQRIHIPNHQVVHLIYIQFLFINYTSIKLGKNLVEYVGSIASEGSAVTPPLFFYSRKHIEQYGKSSVVIIIYIYV